MRNVGASSGSIGIGTGGYVPGSRFGEAEPPAPRVDLGSSGGSGAVQIKPAAGERIEQSGDLYVGPRSQASAAPAAPQISQVETPSGTKNALPLGGDRAILLFNSDCPVCSKIAGWVIANDDPKNGGDQKIDERPIGFDPEALTKLNPNLTIWDAYSTIHVVMPDGSMKVGGEAIAEVLRRLPDTRWATGLLDVGIGGWRPFQSMLNFGYTVLDKLRPALGCKSCGTPTPWWGKPVEWTFNLYQKLTGKAEPPPATTSTPLALNDPPKNM